MIAETTSRFSRSALTIAVVLSVAFPLLCAGQNSPSVYTNPRAGADDPRVGLKAGLYDAGEASFGMERLISLPKPAGFAPDLSFHRCVRCSSCSLTTACRNSASAWAAEWSARQLWRNQLRPGLRRHDSLRRELQRH